MALPAKAKQPSRRISFSVVLPTYNEAGSLPAVVEDIRKTCAGRKFEILVVDDNSPDNTAKVAKSLGVRVIVRKNKRGLSSAILDGILACKAENVFVMDSDGQHDLGNFNKMVGLLASNQADLVIASRRIKQGSARKFQKRRQLVSIGATLLAKPLMKNVSDPMSGFFGVKKRFISKSTPWLLIGFKFLPEIIVHSPKMRIREVPLLFKTRIAGKSKMDSKEILDYAHLMLRLYMYRIGL